MITRKTKTKFDSRGKLYQVYAAKIDSMDNNVQLDGPFEEYYENGQLKEKCTYKDGRQDGLCEQYNKDGQLSAKYTYRSGILNGPYELYEKGGRLFQKGFYVDGKCVPDWADKKELSDLNDKLAELNATMKPTALRQAAKRDLVAEYRERHPKSMNSKKGMGAKLAKMSQAAPAKSQESPEKSQEQIKEGQDPSNWYEAFLKSQKDNGER